MGTSDACNVLETTITMTCSFEDGLRSAKMSATAFYYFLARRLCGCTDDYETIAKRARELSEAMPRAFSDAIDVYELAGADMPDSIAVWYTPHPKEGATNGHV